LKRITGNENFGVPIILLFFFSMLFISEATELVKSINAHGSIILSEPILFTNNAFETITRFCWFIIPFGIILVAIKENDLLLKLTYFLASLPLFLTAPVINKIGFKSIYVIKTLIIFAVIMCIMRYLINTTELYKKALKNIKETDNQ
jgi:hypothetical protein